MTYPFPGMRPAPPSPCGPACEPENHPGQAADLAVVTPWPFGEWIAVVHECWAAGYPLHTIVDLANQGIRPALSLDAVRGTFGFQASALGTEMQRLTDAIVADLSPVQRVVWKVLGWWLLVLEGFEHRASNARAWTARRRLRRELRRDR